MAYGLKYTVNAFDLKGTSLIVEIYSKNYIGSVTQLIPANEAITIQTEDSQDVMKAIIGSSCSLSVVANQSFNLESLYTEDERQFRVVVRRVQSLTLKNLTITWSNDETPSFQFNDSDLQIKINNVVVVDSTINASGSFNAKEGDVIYIQASSVVAWSAGNVSQRLEVSTQATKQQNTQGNLITTFTLGKQDVNISAYTLKNDNFRVIRSQAFTKVCTSGIGTVIAFTKEYQSNISFINAQSIADLDSGFATEGQNNANSFGTCEIGNVIWRGFIPPSNYSEDFTTEGNRVINIEAVDGIALLSGLAFSQNGGDLWIGKMSPKDVIYNCLNKLCTKDQKLFTYFTIYELAMDLTLDPLHQCKIQCETYLDKRSIPKNAYDTLQRILQNFGLQLRQSEGDWYVYEVAQLANTNSFNFYKYSSYNEYLGRELKNLFNNIALIHANGNLRFSQYNQLKEINRPYKQVRVLYEYGLVQSLTDNNFLIVKNGGIQGYTVIAPTRVTFQTDDFGFEIIQDDLSNNQIAVKRNDLIVLSGDTFVLNILFGNFNNSLGLSFKVRCGSFYLKNDGFWTLTDTIIFVINQQRNPESDRTNGQPLLIASDEEKNYRLNLEPIPVNGFLSIEFLENKPVINNFKVGGTVVKFCSIEVVENEELAKGEYYISDNPKSYGLIPEDFKVYHADDQSAKYLGTIYRLNGINPTEAWSRTGGNEIAPLLNLISENILRAYQKPTYKISGSIYGFINQLSKIAVYNENRNFFTLSLNYSLIDNQFSANLYEVLNTAIVGFTGVRYELNYGQYDDDRSTALGSGCDVEMAGVIKTSDSDLLINNVNDFISYGE